MSAGAWHPDPTGRFAQRYHDGQNWTDHVADAAGTPSSDPFSQPAEAGPPTTASTPPPSEAMTSSTFTASAPTGSGPSSAVPVSLIVSGIGLLTVLIAMFGLGWMSVSMTAGPERFDETWDRSELDEAVNDTFPGDAPVIAPSLPEADAPTSLYLSFGWILAIAAAAAAVAVSFASQLRIPIAALCAVGAAWHLIALLGAASFVEDTLESVIGGGPDVGFAAMMLDLDVSIAVGGWVGLVGLVLAAVGAAIAKPRT
ncbi:MAG: DUF2510 domain-containing protein [Acidimicrobiales bacterium]